MGTTRSGRTGDRVKEGVRGGEEVCVRRGGERVCVRMGERVEGVMGSFRRG